MVHKQNGVNGTNRFPCKTCSVGTVTVPGKICGACEIDSYVREPGPGRRHVSHRNGILPPDADVDRPDNLKANFSERKVDTEDTETQEPNAQEGDVSSAPLSPSVSPCASVSPVSSESLCVRIPDEKARNEPPEYLACVFSASREKPLPRVAARYYVPGMRLLIGLCAELQIPVGSGTWFLACRDAAFLLGEDDYRRVSRWLTKLEADGVLERVSTGSLSSHKANEYRFVGQR
jgi:hypothetical protein